MAGACYAVLTIYLLHDKKSTCSWRVTSRPRKKQYQLWYPWYRGRVLQKSFQRRRSSGGLVGKIHPDQGNRKCNVCARPSTRNPPKQWWMKEFRKVSRAKTTPISGKCPAYFWRTREVGKSRDSFMYDSSELTTTELALRTHSSGPDPRLFKWFGESMACVCAPN